MLLCCIHDFLGYLEQALYLFSITLQVIVAVNIIGWCVMWKLRRERIDNYENKHVLITGCDSGFGLLLAKRLDKLGFRVFAGCLTQLGQQNVKGSCSSNVIVLEINVTLKESIARAKTIVNQHLPENKGLWAVVNNAGIAGPVAHTEWLTEEDFEQTIGINLMGVIYVTKSFLPLVRKEKGRIVNMASICGRLAVATSAYSASKFGVEGFTDALRHDLYSTGCSVSVVEPGFFNTGIVSQETIRQGIDRKFNSLDEEVKKYYGEKYKNGSIKKYQDFLSLVLSSKVDKVVNAYEHAVTAKYPKIRYTVGWDANSLFRVLMLLPDGIADFLFGILQETPSG